MQPRKRILLIWDHHRKDLMLPFIRLQHQFDFCLLYFKYPEENREEPIFPYYFWSHFKHADELLATIRPDKIVFSEIETYDELALNITARHRGIPTIVLAHGQRLAAELSVDFSAVLKSLSQQTQAHAQLPANYNRWHTYFFLLYAFRFVPLSRWPVLCRFILLRKKLHLTEAKLRCPFEERRPTFYIDFCIAYAEYYERCDQVPSSRIRIIGNPFLDHIFRADIDKQPEYSGTEPYFLLIDTLLVEAKQLGDTNIVQKVGFYLKLASYCESQGAILVVKLHPRIYNASYLPIHSSIRYVREVALHKLIVGARGCFAIVSTLVESAIILNKLLLFRNEQFQGYQQEFLDNGSAQMLEMHTFEPADITLHNFEPNPDGNAFIIHRYLHSIDGRATERLAAIFAE